jgi:methylaspartate mutase S subunit
MKQATVITGTLGSDAHVIGTKVLSRALKDAGFNVVPLGIQIPPEDFLQKARDEKADAVLVSSLYGMAELDLKGFKEKREKAGLHDVLFYIGGVLNVGRLEFNEYEEKFKNLGFDRVYPPEADLESAINDLKNDLKSKGKL